MKKKVLELKDSAIDASKWALDYSAWKLANSKLTLSNNQDLKKFIDSSKTTTGVDSKTGKNKNYIHRVIVIFANTQSGFFKKMLYRLPLLSAKAFSQNIALRLADISMKCLDTEKLGLESEETLIVIENKKVIKTLSWAENIQKVVNALSLDINKTIEEL